MSGAALGARDRRVLVAIALAGAALRAVWAASVEVDPRTVFHWDMTFYDLAALRFVDGALMRDFDGVATAKWSPGYPVLLGTAYLVFGSGLAVAKGLNVVLGGLAIALTGALGARLFGARVGLAAAAILAVWPGHVLYAPVLLSENAFVALFAATLWLFVRFEQTPGADRRWIGFGALLAVTLFVRGAVAFFLIVPALLWWRARGTLRAVLRPALLAAAGLVAVVAPWTLRNWVTMGYPVVISTQQMGMALTFAHSEAATGGMSMSMERFRNDLLVDVRDLPQPEREIAEYRIETRRALRFALTHPLEELAMLPRRWHQLVKHDHTGMTWSTPRGEGGRPLRPVVGPRADGWIRWGADLFFFVLLAPALWGLRACVGSSTRERPLLPLTLLYFAGLHGLLFAGDPRFHAPLYPVLAILAAAGGSDAISRLRAARQSM